MSTQTDILYLIAFRRLGDDEMILEHLDQGQQDHSDKIEFQLALNEEGSY